MTDPEQENPLREIITWQMKIRIWSPACQKMQDQVTSTYFQKAKMDINEQQNKQSYTWLLVIPFEAYTSS